MSKPKYYVGQKWKLIKSYGFMTDHLQGRTYELKLQNNLVGLYDTKIELGHIATTRSGAHKVYDPNNISGKEWARISGCIHYHERIWEEVKEEKQMNPYDTAPLYIRPTRVLKVEDINNKISSLSTLIRKESNSKEKSRMVDEQAALKLVLRLMKEYTTRDKCLL